MARCWPWTRQGSRQFTDLLTGPTALAYAAFDLLWLNGRDPRHLLLTRRKAELAALIPTSRAHVFKLLSVDERGWDLFEAVQRTDFEGIVAKRKADPYAAGTIWFKVKTLGTVRRPGRVVSSIGLVGPSRRSAKLAKKASPETGGGPES